MGNCASARAKTEQKHGMEEGTQIDTMSFLAAREQELAHVQEDLEASNLYGANTFTEVLTVRSQMRRLDLQFDRIRRQMQRQISEMIVDLKTKDDLLTTQRQIAEDKTAKVYSEHIALQQGHQEHILMLETALQRTQAETAGQRTDLERALKEREEICVKFIELKENRGWLLAEKEHWEAFWSNRCDEAELRVLEIGMKYRALVSQHAHEKREMEAWHTITDWQLQHSQHNLFLTLQQAHRFEELWNAAQSVILKDVAPGKVMAGWDTTKDDYISVFDRCRVRCLAKTKEAASFAQLDLRDQPSTAEAELTKLREASQHAQRFKQLWEVAQDVLLIGYTLSEVMTARGSKDYMTFGDRCLLRHMGNTRTNYETAQRELNKLREALQSQASTTSV